MSSSTINAKLSEGLDVIISAGIYYLDTALKVEHDNQVILGIGIPTMVANNGEPAIQVGNVDGVRIAGMLLQAGPKRSPALLMWGDGSHAGTASNPGIMQDVPMRVGGPQASGVQADTMLTINSGHVIGDCLWLWRADHTIGGVGIIDGNNPVPNGAVINGNDVTMYGLMVEHATEDLVQWNGERGVTYFMQSELPYDVTESYGTSGYVGYRVNDQVQEHDAYGIGIYHFFRDYPVVVESAIKVPSHLVSRFESPLSVYLNGMGTVKHIINELGDESSMEEDDTAFPVWYCPGGPQPAPRPSPTPSPMPSPTPSPTPPSPTPSPAPSPVSPCAFSCSVGDGVACPSGGNCGGNQCCSDGSTCPSAESTFTGCGAPKGCDCTTGGSPTPTPTPAPTPTPSPAPSPVPTPSTGTCSVGEAVACPSGGECGGNQCCSDGSTCPSADNSFTGCGKAKSFDCTTGLIVA